MTNVDPNCPACHQPLGSTVNCRNCGNYRRAMQRPALKRALPPAGAFCSHERMRHASCSYCAPRPCRVECPDCGLTWLLDEDP